MVKQIILAVLVALIYFGSNTSVVQNYFLSVTNSDRNIINQQLLSASVKGNIDKVKQLVKDGGDINYHHPKNGATPLLIASRKRNFELVKYFVSIGANIDIKDKKNSTALLLAIGRNQIKIVNYLLSHGAKLTIGNKGLSPLMFAASSGGDEIIKILIKKMRMLIWHNRMVGHP